MKKSQILLLSIMILILVVCAVCIMPERHIAAEWDKSAITSLLDSEEIMIDNIKIRLDTYLDKGVKLCAAFPVDEKTSDMNDETNKKELMKMMENSLAESNMSGVMYENSDKANGGKCEAYHKGWWNKEMSSLSSQNGMLYGIISENHAAKMMTLSQNIKASGAALTVRTPAGFERSGDSYVWKSETYENVLMMCAHTGEIKVSSLIGTQKLTINSGMEIYPDEVSSYLMNTTDSRQMILFAEK